MPEQAHRLADVALHGCLAAMAVWQVLMGLWWVAAVRGPLNE